MVLTTWRGETACPYRDSNSDSSAVQHVGSRYTDCATPAPSLTACLYIFYFEASVFSVNSSGNLVSHSKGRTHTLNKSCKICNLAGNITGLVKCGRVSRWGM
jgi:hypothetical protein